MQQLYSRHEDFTNAHTHIPSLALLYSFFTTGAAPGAPAAIHARELSRHGGQEVSSFPHRGSLIASKPSLNWEGSTCTISLG
ncbi:hypothetical protein EX30DRAFT_61126 [Ascodesmis nigricans]|uniref:Uncharacterized protein n=1 Tax=Ascodesmis nigricans TaxID=341454 RepID=A0A4S2MUE1_9PEZI|nr:hypothetical protein EX30DRAFT_61126 [Ascodesmis nigricans]